MLDRVFYRPILKWLGGKTDSLNYIFSWLPENGKRFIEPFMGSAIVGLNYEQVPKIMADINSDLVNLYRHAVSSTEVLATKTKELFIEVHNNANVFYEIREHFNSLTRDGIERAVFFVYLNRHCFNGVCRYNSKGGFNVPFGKYKTTYAPVKEIIQFGQRMKDVSFLNTDFREVFKQVQAGDVVYCDPPYLQLKENGFVNYSGDGFGPEDQTDLANLARQAAENGATVAISNHDTPDVDALYAGATINRVNVRRYVNRNADDRSAAPEILAVFSPK
jgi:DNA adenine methylase